MGGTAAERAGERGHRQGREREQEREGPGRQQTAVPPRSWSVPPRPAPPSAAPRPRPPRRRCRTPVDLTPRTALPIIVIGHLWYPLIAVVFLVSEGTPPARPAVYTADIVAVVALQAHHVRPRPPGVAPRWAAWTLPAQALLAAAPLLAPERPYPQLTWLAAGAILIVLAERPGWAWTLTAGYVALVPATLLAAGRDPLEAALWTAETAGGAMMFYGLALLTRLVHRVHEARVSLALLAVAEERRRIARDVHDLLGSGLWTIMVKADLAVRDPDRAGESLADIAAAARRTLGDLRAIPDGAAAPSAAAELGSARELLAAAGADVTVRAVLAHGGDDPRPVPDLGDDGQVVLPFQQRDERPADQVHVLRQEHPDHPRVSPATRRS
ncbi:hypothetical protein GCM10010182_74400 [Actinomadura cremea]|nr:hypothetical protein GCM10010182_74400 [Actinomadura cremea]